MNLNPFRSKQEKFVTDLIQAVRYRLFLNTILGLFTVVATGLSAAFGFYVRELPDTLRKLNSTVETLNTTIQEQEQINERQDDESKGLERRVTILETKIDDN